MAIEGTDTVKNSNRDAVSGSAGPQHGVAAAEQESDVAAKKSAALARVAVAQSARPGPADSGPTVRGVGWKEEYMGGSLKAEQAQFATIGDQVHHIADEVAARQDAPVHRTFHNKGDIISAQFSVDPNLPSELRSGFLQPGSTYSAFARFSRSQSLHAKDSALDERGFALRLDTPDGAQDFLSNTPRTFARDPMQFLKAGDAFARGNMLTTLPKLAKAVGWWEALRIIKQLATESPSRHQTFTSSEFWSRTPFQINKSAVKLTLVPDPKEPVYASGSGADYLTDQLHGDLRQGPQKFKLYAQFYVDDQKTPIEDGLKVWEEKDSPLVPVGTLTLPKQDLDSPASKAFTAKQEKEAAFSPWNGKSIHPLGAFNRARQIAYDQSAEHRGGCPLGYGR